MSTISRDELFRLLDARLADPSIAAAQDAELWERCAVDCAVLVIDLSGFTRLTRERGILHFLSVYRRALKIACPLVESHHGRCVKLDADNVIGTFPRAIDALVAARAIRDATVAANVTLSNDERVHVCQGIGFGKILELADDVYGDEVNIAFKLGEDVARAEEILVSEAAAEQVRGEDGGKLELSHAVTLGGVAVRYFDA
ncbi:MAG: adenylate/guanylate cyclase domain-containing protein [Polyangiales bacterium]